MKKYRFRIYQGGEDDGSNVWTVARNLEAAIEEIKSEYWGLTDIEFLGESDYDEEDF